MKVTRTAPNRSYPGRELWIVVCCYCGREHVHGDGAGHRAADCADRPESLPGYYVDAPERTTP